MIVIRHRTLTQAAAAAWLTSSVLAFGLNSPAQAEMSNTPSVKERGTLSFTWENDYFANTDRNYSNGIKLGYFSRPVSEDTGWGWMAHNLFGADTADQVRYGVAVGHSIFTPEDRLATEPLPDQHPYAGWLYGEFAVTISSNRAELRGGRLTFRRLETFTLQAGIVGPAANGEWVQNNFHDLIDDDRLLGWDNQLENEPGFVLSYDRKFGALVQEPILGVGFDLTPSVGFSAGNVLTQAKAGVTMRVGMNLRENQAFGPPRVRPSLAGDGFFSGTNPFSWYLFAGVDGRAVARNIFLDGNTFRDSLSVDKKPFVADFQVGAVVQIKRVQISYTYVTRTEEFETQTDRQQFGAVNIAFKL